MVSVMNKAAQILLIEKFLISNEETLLINQVSDELGIFYLSIIKYYADKQGIKINVDDNNETKGAEDDLFGQKEIKTILSSEIIDAQLNCSVFNDETNVSQFYIYVSGNKFLSNKAAQKKIKKDNTELVVRQFINKIKNIDHECYE